MCRNRVYEIFLKFPLSFAVNLKLLYKIKRIKERERHLRQYQQKHYHSSFKQILCHEIVPICSFILIFLISYSKKPELFLSLCFMF